MAFYSPTWVRRLVKEDHNNIQKYLLDSNSNSFRSYIDANTPFVLWLEIGLIRERILTKPETLAFVQELAEAVSTERDVSDIVLELLDKAYVETINAYGNNPAYKKITDTQLEEYLNALTISPVGGVKTAIQSLFKRTMVITNVTKKNKSVMLILPKFTTLEFGKVFKASLEKVINSSKKLQSAKPSAAIGGMFGQLGGGTSSEESEKSKMLAFISGNFAKLQNVGHVEVDVISDVDKTVKRAQNSPRLLQALVSIPENDSKAFQRLQLKFSKETGQASTRVKIRKKFSGSKMVFELLVEHGLAVGIPETQKENLDKAKLEKAFKMGSGLSATLRKDVSIFADLETSKSLRGYTVGAYLETLKTGKASAYSSDTTIKVDSKTTRTKVSVEIPKSGSVSSLPKLASSRSKKMINLTALKVFLDSYLIAKVRANMGDGTRRDILNLRSGRFAESVKVDRLSASRAGMITVFYDYMRNPYSTFSAGGAQQSPKTRDPKLLISTSIRELMAEKVKNRLRSVLV
jgi:hypothetical protein